ncbi:hypothetical protein D3C87_1712340 [compost metagenome]
MFGQIILSTTLQCGGFRFQMVLKHILMRYLPQVMVKEFIVMMEDVPKTPTLTMAPEECYREENTWSHPAGMRLKQLLHYLESFSNKPV